MKYAADIADLCYAMRNEQLVPRTLLKNGKRSATQFLASRSKSPSSQVSHNTSTTDNGPQTSGSNPSPDHHCSDFIHHPQLNGAITSLTRDLGSLRYDITQLKSEVMGLRNATNSEACVIYVRLKNVELGNVCESFLNTILNCPSICYSIIRNACTISLWVRILACHLHSALTSTDVRLVTVSLWKPSRTSAIPSSATTDEGGAAASDPSAPAQSDSSESDHLELPRSPKWRTIYTPTG